MSLYRPTPDDAFTEAYRSHRLELGDHPSTLPPPIGSKSISASRNSGTKRKRSAAASPDDNRSTNDAAAGGFIVDDSGDDEMRRHPMPDSGDDDIAGGGGFIVDDDEDRVEDEGNRSASQDSHREEPSAQDAIATATYLPLQEVPHALSILSLPADDEGILSVFKSAAIDDPTATISATGGARRRGAAAAGRPKVISREDFKQVCEVLMSDEANDQASAVAASGASRNTTAEPRTTESKGRPSRLAAAKQRRVARAQMEELDAQSDGGSEDAYEASSDEDAAESTFSASDDGKPRKGRRSRADAHTSSARKGRPTKGSTSAASTPSKQQGQRRRRRKAKSSDEDNDSGDDSDGSGRATAVGKVKLTAEQRDIVHGAWSLFTEKLEEVYPEWGGERLGKRELQRLAISVGEKINDKEIDEMLKLAFASFAPASSRYATRETAQAARVQSATMDASGTTTEGGVGIDEFAGVLLKGRMI